jgi:transcriptional regulator with XRE-family HTH domain
MRGPNTSSGDEKQHAAPGLAANIRAFRKARGWSQGELAERIGAHLTHVSRVETGKYNPGLDFLVRAAEAFGVTLDELVWGEDSALDEVRVEDRDLAERLRLLETLDESERGAVITVIDAMLTKHRMRRVIEGQQPAAG